MQTRVPHHYDTTGERWSPCHNAAHKRPPCPGARYLSWAEQPGAWDSEWMASLLAVPANEGMRSARLGGTGSLGHRRAPGACRPVENGWVGHVAIAGRRPRSGASRRRASLSRPCASQQGWRRGLGLFAAETRGVQSSRATVEAGQPRWWLGMCSGSTSEQPDRLARGTRARTSRPAARPATRFWGVNRGQKVYSGKRLRVRRSHP